MTVFLSFLSLNGLFLSDFANDGLGFLVRLVEERLLTRQLGLNLSGQLEPFFFQSGLEVSQRTDDLLPRESAFSAPRGAFGRRKKAKSGSRVRKLG